MSRVLLQDLTPFLYPFPLPLTTSGRRARTARIRHSFP